VVTGEKGREAAQHMRSIMPLYFFRISHGRYAGASDQGSEFESREAAWTEMTRVCGNLLGSLSRGLKQNAEWQMELLIYARAPRNFTDTKLTIASNLMRTVAEYSRRIED
jgi:hypothetical protein